METYEDFIQNILNTRGRFACGDEYHERHHIVPKSCGGANDENNLIDLFAREHFEAHRLLAIENQDNEKLVYAWWCMSTLPGSSKRREDITPNEYEEARISFIKFYSGENHPMYGKHHSEETRKKMKENHADVFGENNPFYGKRHSEEVRNKISESRAGKNTGENNPNYGKPMSDKQRAKISETLKGKMAGANNPMYGVHRCGVDNPMYGKCQSDETREKMSQSRIGKYSGEDNPNARKIIRLSDLKIYNCGKFAAEDNGISQGTLCYHYNKHKKFMYYDEWIAEQNNISITDTIQN